MGLKRTDEFRKDAVRIAADQWANAKQVRRRSWCRHVDAEQMDHSTPRHRCGVERRFEPRSRE